MRLTGHACRWLGLWLVLQGTAATSAPADCILLDVGPATTWRYDDSGAGAAPGWSQLQFDDSAWKRGAAPLGYGEPGLETVVDYGSQEAAKHLTTYFRSRFEVVDAARWKELLILLRVDDGAVVYLNGRELVRENLPAGAVDARTTAELRIDGDAEGEFQRFVVPADGLRNGGNVVAVEVHQFNASSSDLYFDLLVKGYAADETPQPAQIPESARDVARTYRGQHRLEAGVLIPDGFADGGRRMQLAPTGEVATDREVIIVDRSRDVDLRRQLAFARSEFIASLAPLLRARFLALNVDLQCSPPQGRGAAEARCALLEAEFRDRAMPLSAAVGAGVCRHRALLFKLLGDEAGLRVSLVRGNYAGGGHTWNELRSDDGPAWIVDCMNPRGGFDFFRTTDPQAREYLTVDDQPYYPPAPAP